MAPWHSRAVDGRDTLSNKWRKPIQWFVHQQEARWLLNHTSQAFVRPTAVEINKQKMKNKKKNNGTKYESHRLNRWSIYLFVARDVRQPNWNDSLSARDPRAKPDYPKEVGGKCLIIHNNMTELWCADISICATGPATRSLHRHTAFVFLFSFLFLLLAVRAVSCHAHEWQV